MSTNVKNAPVALNLRGVLVRMERVPVVLNVEAKSANYSLHRQFFSKVPGFMSPIAEATAIVRQRKVRLIRLRAARKRKPRLTKFRSAGKRKLRPIRYRVVRKRKVRPIRLRAVGKKKLRLTKYRVARNQRVNSLSGVFGNQGLDKVM
jgi:hypothetical protein